MLLVINGIEFTVDEEGNRIPVAPPTRLEVLEKFESNIRTMVTHHMEVASSESNDYFSLLDELVHNLRKVEVSSNDDSSDGKGQEG